MTQIKFGTSGWRAVVAEEFTFANVRRAVHGIARYVCSQKASGAKVIVGRDPRFLGETFCTTAADILSSYAITPLLIAEPAPTPTISYAVIQSKADGAINFTASHNPPEYNGIRTRKRRARRRQTLSPLILAACTFRACARPSISTSSGNPA